VSFRSKKELCSHCYQAAPLFFRDLICLSFIADHLAMLHQLSVPTATEMQPAAAPQIGSTPALLSTPMTMDTPTAFAAVALASVSWDGALTMAGTRALRHALDYRPPFRGRSDGEMIALMDQLLRSLRERGAGGLMEDAAAVLDERQRHTAYAVAVEIMRSDGPLQEEERQILERLASHLDLDETETSKVAEVMDVLHASIVEPAGSGDPG
jgi:tellurite resistance protein